MIRINLLPSKKPAKAAKKKGSSSSSVAAPSSGQYILIGMLAGWVVLGGVGYWLIELEAEHEQEIRKETKEVEAKVKEISDQIDEEKLQALRDKVEQVRAAIDKLQTRRRTPAHVMHELANILTTGQGPDIDEEEQRRRNDQDPDAALNTMWDANGVWVDAVSETKGGLIEISGGARDASDLSEFVKRLRASRRLGKVSHPEYTNATKKKAPKKGENTTSFITFKLTVKVRYWD